MDLLINIILKFQFFKVLTSSGHEFNYPVFVPYLLYEEMW